MSFFAYFVSPVRRTSLVVTKEEKEDLSSLEREQVDLVQAAQAAPAPWEYGLKITTLVYLEIIILSKPYQSTTPPRASMA